jgi:hypothetical protein
MPSRLTSSIAKVRDPKKIRQLIRAYKLEGVKVDLRKEGSDWVLVFEDEDNEVGNTPLAVRRDELPGKDEFASPKEWEKAKQDSLSPEGWIQFLGEIAGHLKVPLLIVDLLLVATRGAVVNCNAFMVQPGREDVEIVTTGLTAEAKDGK